MEQIKRQVVVQRGSMVAALKIMAELRSRSSQNNNSSKSSSFQSEQDRALTSISINNKVVNIINSDHQKSLN